MLDWYFIFYTLCPCVFPTSNSRTWHRPVLESLCHVRALMQLFILASSKAHKFTRTYPSVSNRRKGKSIFDKWATQRMKLSILILFVSLHPTLTKCVFEFFMCSEPIAGKQLLVQDASVFCWESEHWNMLTYIGLPPTILYVIGIPATL